MHEEIIPRSSKRTPTGLALGEVEAPDAEDSIILKVSFSSGSLMTTLG
jgi:hypothetical protein